MPKTKTTTSETSDHVAAALANVRAANESLRCADLNKWSRYFKQRDEAMIRRETWADRYGEKGRGYSTSEPVVPNPLRELHRAIDDLERAASDPASRARVEAMLRLPAWQVAPVRDDDPDAPDGGPFDLVARPRPIPMEVLDSFLSHGPRYRDGKWFSVLLGKRFADALRQHVGRCRDNPSHPRFVGVEPGSKPPRYNVDDVARAFPTQGAKILEAIAHESP
jgi:hypothetical protein